MHTRDISSENIFETFIKFLRAVIEFKVIVRR